MAGRAILQTNRLVYGPLNSSLCPSAGEASINFRKGILLKIWELGQPLTCTYFHSL